MKKLFLIGLFIILTPVLVFAATDVSFRWDANSESDLAGYRLWRATSSGGPYNLVHVIPAASTETTDSAVADGTYFWVLTAFDTEGLESDYSVEATTSLDSTPPDAPQNFTIWQKIIAWIEDGSTKLYGWVKNFFKDNPDFEISG